MILDKRWIFSDNDTVTETDDCQNIVDTQIADANQGAGHKFHIVVDVHTLFAGGTSMAAALQDCATVDGSWRTLVSSGVVLTAALVAGYRLLDCILPTIHLRFLKILYTVVGTMNAGTVEAYAALF